MDKSQIELMINKATEENRHIIRTEVQKTLIVIEDKLDDLKECISDMKQINAVQAEKMEAANGFRLAQDDLNKSTSMIMKKISDEKLDRGVFLTVIFSVIGILLTMLGGMFVWTSARFDTLDSRVNSMSVDVQIIRGMFEHLEFENIN